MNTSQLTSGQLLKKGRNLLTGSDLGCVVDDLTAITSVLPPSNPYRFNLTQTSALSATSGLLTIGVRYCILTFATGDVFTNVGALSNASNVYFTATATTPTDWSNGSVVIHGFDPTATVLWNLLSGTPVWTRTNVGTYDSTLASAFLSGKVFTSAGILDKDLSRFTISRVSNNVMRLKTYDSSGVLADDLLDSGVNFAGDFLITVYV